MQNTINMRLCPICGSAINKIIYSQNFYIGNRSHEIVVCKLCGFIYVRNAKSQKELSTYYKDDSKYEIERDHDLHKEYQKIIAEFVKKTDSVLDIGCSTGHLLSLLKKQGFRSLLGIDPSLQCQSIAKEKYGIKVLNTDLLNFSSHTRFHCVILAAVLEHIEDLQACISKIDTLLSDRGILFIVVPNAEAFTYTDKEPFAEFSTEHINFFSFSHLQLLLKEYSCIFCKADGNILYTLWKKKIPLEEIMCKYIAGSKKKEAIIRKFIDRLPNHTLIWGVGALTQRLMTSTNLSKKAVAFIDVDIKKNKTLPGYQVITPNEISLYKEPICICSYRFRDEILTYIKEHKIPNKIFVLP